jgi:hypothetical protein
MEEFLVLQFKVNDCAERQEIEEDVRQELLDLINREFYHPSGKSLTRKIYQLLQYHQKDQDKIST